MTDIAFVDGICTFLDALLCHDKATAEAFKAKSVDEQKLTYEGYFLSALMWTVGACVADDKAVNYRYSTRNISHRLAPDAFLVMVWSLLHFPVSFLQ